jgi:putative SOS response-associated peptidase YedK
MCGRFTFLETLGDLAQTLQISQLPNQEIPISWNIKPTQDVYFIKEDSLEIASWGMIAPWSKSLAEARKSQSIAINARSETVHERPTFRNSLRTSRCLIPASGYYEWASELGEYKPRQPVYISHEENSILTFAGIYDRWVSPQGEEFSSVSIITRSAVGDLATVHSRMPVFLPPDRISTWLDPNLTDVQTIRSLFEGFEPDLGLRFWPVSDLVNSIKNDGAELVSPIRVVPETLF